MRTSRVLPLLIVSFFGFGLLGSVVWAQDSPAPKPDRITKQIERLTRTLDLTETQQQMVRVILEDKQPKIDALQEQLRALRKETEDSINGILTDEQKAKKAELKSSRPASRRGFQRGRGARGPQGRLGQAGPMGMFPGLNLTDEQKTEIQEIMRSRREAIEKVLTDEQKAQLKENRPNMWQKRGEMKERGAQKGHRPRKGARGQGRRGG